MMALAGISGDPKYRDALLAMGEAPLKPGPRIYHADDLPSAKRSRVSIFFTATRK